MNTKPRSIDGTGSHVDPRLGVVPIVMELKKGKLAVIGTGFYITRYGLFLTAKHVLELMVKEGKFEERAFILHQGENDKVHLRRIRSINLFNDADIGAGQAENYEEKFPNNPLRCMRGNLSDKIPSKNATLITYAYPENETLDFTQESPPIIKSDYYEGQFLEHVTNSDFPFIPYPHYQTSIKIKSGASGGPVFCDGKIIGVNCRGWDLEEGENDLSSIVPISSILEMVVRGLQVPKISWEYREISKKTKKTEFTIRDLINFGHVQFTTL